ncbi:hypothetical protein PSPO01_11741 [Paraphaeosphaeria sporulosa]
MLEVDLLAPKVIPIARLPGNRHAQSDQAAQQPSCSWAQCTRLSTRVQGSRPHSESKGALGDDDRMWPTTALTPVTIDAKLRLAAATKLVGLPCFGAGTIVASVIASTIPMFCAQNRMRRGELAGAILEA